MTGLTLMSPLALWHPHTAWTHHLCVSPSSPTSLRFKLTPYTRPIRLRTPANLRALALRYFDCYQCAHWSTTSCTMFRDDEFRFCMIILLICTHLTSAYARSHSHSASLARTRHCAHSALRSLTRTSLGSHSHSHNYVERYYLYSVLMICLW